MIDKEEWMKTLRTISKIFIRKNFIYNNLGYCRWQNKKNHSIELEDSDFNLWTSRKIEIIKRNTGLYGNSVLVKVLANKKYSEIELYLPVWMIAF